MAKRPRRIPRPTSLTARELQGLNEGELKKTTVWIPIALWDRLSATAAGEIKTTSGLLRELVVEGLQKRQGAGDGLFG